MPDKNKEYKIKFQEIGSRPSRKKEDLPIWADYIELVCLLKEEDKTTSRADIYDLVYRDSKGVTPKDADMEDVEDEEEQIEVEIEEEDIDIEDADAVKDHSKTALANDNRSRIVNDWFNYLYTRSISFGDLYPFEMNLEDQTLTIKTNLNNDHKLYIYFLLASYLKILSKPLENIITTDFEFISLEAQSLVFQLNLGFVKGKTLFFGKNPETNSGGQFQGNLANKLTTLGSILKSHRLNINGIDDDNQGDGGIDIVSFFDFENDHAFGLPIALGQCACSYTEWSKKQFDHHHLNYDSYGVFDADYIRFMFIPFYYRDNNGKWFKPLSIKKTVLFDRLRLMKTLCEDEQPISNRALKWAEALLLAPTQRQDALERMAR